MTANSDLWLAVTRTTGEALRRLNAAEDALSGEPREGTTRQQAYDGYYLVGAMQDANGFYGKLNLLAREAQEAVKADWWEANPLLRADDADGTITLGGTPIGRSPKVGGGWLAVVLAMPGWSAGWASNTRLKELDAFVRSSFLSSAWWAMQGLAATYGGEAGR